MCLQSRRLISRFSLKFRYMWDFCVRLSHVYTECKKETDLGKLVPEVPTLLGSLRSRVVSAQAEVQIPNEKHREILIFVDLESYLIENKIQKHECTSTHFVIGFLTNSCW